MAANVLVVASQTAASHQLLDALKARAERSPIKVTLVMPAQGPGLAGRDAMREQLEQVLARGRGAGEGRQRLVEPPAVEVRVEVAEARRQAAPHLAVSRRVLAELEPAAAVA